MSPHAMAAYAVVTAAVAILGVQYLRALEPVANGDRFAGCRALGPNESPKLGELPAQAPDFVAPDLAGGTTTLAAYRGKVVLVNFWQTQCPPCKEEAPSMERLQQAFPDGDFVILGLASETSFDPVRLFYKNGSATTALLDPPDDEHPTGPISRAWGTEKWPDSYLVDRDGMIRYYFINGRKWDSGNAVSCVQALLNE
jgi:peroxiredoxin